MAEPKYGALNAGGNRSIWNEKAIKGITDTAAAQKNIGGIESAAGGLAATYGGLQGAYDQQQNAGVYEMRRLAGQQFASVAGRGGASNVMAAGAGDSATKAMSGQVGQFMGDMAAAKAQAAIAGAQAQYGAEKELYEYRQKAAAADVDAAQLFESMGIFDNMAEDFKKSLNEQAQSFLLNNDQVGLAQWINSFQDPIERRAAFLIAEQQWRTINNVGKDDDSIFRWEDWA